MPLALHLSSCCDVCLDPYSFVTPDTTPHAIPCGHIFCRNCLLSVEPPNCPLCRRPFNQDRIKKLHVEPPELDPERDLLHRLALAFDADTDEQARISDDLNAWLTGRPEDHHQALRKAWAAFKIYIKLNERRQHDKQKIRRSERQIQQLIEDSEYTQDTYKAVESSLLAQVAELSAQVRDLEGQLNPLRNELSRYQHTANPLPAPPEPVPLDRFPAFARPAAESKEGFAAYFTPGRPAPELFPRPELPATDKGKGRQQPFDLFSNPNGNVIIPGASPSQRVIPNSAEDVANHAYHTHAPASAYVNGYASGFGQGYGAANGAGIDYNLASNHASTSAYQLPPRAEEPEDTLESSLGNMRLWGGGAAEASIAPPSWHAPDSAPPIMPVRRRHAYIAPPPSSTADDTSISSQATRPSALRRSTVQVDGHLPNGHGHAPYPPIYANPPPPQHNTAVRFNTQAQDREQGAPTQEAIADRARHERNRLNRQSYSSWGTVHTNDSPATRGSMSDLGLTNFTGARNSFALSEGITDREPVGTPTQDTAHIPLGFTAPAPAQRPVPAHSYSLPGNGVPTIEEAQSYDPNSLLQRATRTNNRQRNVPRRFSQLPTDASELGMAITPGQTPVENALGLDLGMEAAPAPMIMVPTPRVQMDQFLRSFR